MDQPVNILITTVHGDRYAASGPLTFFYKDGIRMVRIPLSEKESITMGVNGLYVVDIESVHL